MKEKSEVIEMFVLAVGKDEVKHYKKCQKVDARVSTGGETIVTIIDGKEETKNTTKDGDYIVRAQTKSQEQYVVPSDKFAKRYTPNPDSKPDSEGFKEYLPIGEVYAFQYEGEDFTFKAPWGEEMSVVSGDYIAVPNIKDMSDIYRIEKETFGKTYKEIE